MDWLDTDLWGFQLKEFSSPIIPLGRWVPIIYHVWRSHSPNQSGLNWLTGAGFRGFWSGRFVVFCLKASCEIQTWCQTAACSVSSWPVNNLRSVHLSSIGSAWARLLYRSVYLSACRRRWRWERIGSEACGVDANKMKNKTSLAHVTLKLGRI